MLKQKWMKILCCAAAAGLCLLAACSGDKAADSDSGVPAVLEGQAESAPQEEPAAGGSLELETYMNAAYGFSMDLPVSWSVEETEEDGSLTMLASNDDFSQSVFVLTRDIPAEAPTLEDYRATGLDELREMYGEDVVFGQEEILPVNGVDFLKVVATDATSGFESYQVIYTAYTADRVYEITLTLPPDFAQQNAGTLAAMENSLRLNA